MNILKKLFSKPKTSSLTVTSSSGFHLRPVAQFVNIAKESSAAISATFGDKTVNAKAVNTLLSLNLEKGDTFEITSRDERAIESLTNCFVTLMQNDQGVITPQTQERVNYESQPLYAQSIVSGIAIAPLYAIQQRESYHENSTKLADAIERAEAELTELYASQQGDNRTIYLAQKELLSSLVEGVGTLEELEETIARESHALQGGKLEAKRVDYLDILQRVKRHLGYSSTLLLPTEPSILVADDLLPSDILLLEESQVVGVILKETTPTSHTAILLKDASIPSVIVKEHLPLVEGVIVLDADAGLLLFDPSSADLAAAQTQHAKNQKSNDQAYTKRHTPALTQTGKAIHILANVADEASAKIAKEQGAEGIGLLRTEFLFKETKPSVAEQREAYEAIFALFDEITVRTLDVGGDKALPYIDIPHEENPFLGIRGVRLFASHPDLIAEQLMAIFGAADNRPLKIMFPMVATVADFVDAKAFALEVASRHQIDISNIEFGMMIEVPSALFLISEFNEVVDFYSIGTNDLTQYLFAIERTHPTLKTDALSPVVFAALEKILDQSTKPTSICGELASDPKAVEKLLALGLTTLSVSPKTIPQTKETIRHTQPKTLS